MGRLTERVGIAWVSSGGNSPSASNRCLWTKITLLLLQNPTYLREFIQKGRVVHPGPLPHLKPCSIDHHLAKIFQFAVSLDIVTNCRAAIPSKEGV